MIVQLPIPQDRSELSLHRVGSWDQEGGNNSSQIHSNSYLESSLCPHAVCFGSFVYGVRQIWKDGDSWLTWKTSFAPYQVCRVVSNRDGSIIVCSTDAETVALLRGTDGAVLATRKVSNGENGAVSLPAHASFIARDPSNDDGKDAVLIGFPSSATSAKTNFMLVSNIEARNLNNSNPIKFSEAARKMTINNSLKFKSGGNKVIMSLCGCFMGEKRIRFFSLDQRGRIGCHDYTGADTPMKTVADSLQWNTTKNRSSSVDQSIGLRIHECLEGKIYVMFATESSVMFLDPVQLKIAGACEISSISPTVPNKTKILSIEPIESSSSDSGLAAAMVLKPRGEDGTIIGIMETLVNDARLGKFHQVYTVNIKGTLVALSFASLQYKNHGSYSILYKVGQGTENYACKAFVSSNESHDGTAIGKIRLLIQAERFDEADILINSIGEAALVADEYAYFHPSEVALGRLQHILKQGNVSEKASMTQARHCFHRLSSGSISGSEPAQYNLLSAADSIAEWASPGSSQNPPTAVEVNAALSTVSRVLGEVLKMLPSDRHPLFKEKQIQIEDQLATLRHLSGILPKQTEERHQFSRHFQGSRNPGELFLNLIVNGYFPQAEELWNSNLRRKIYPDVAVKAIIGINARADPAGYIVMLEEFIIPSLSRNFELLPPLWTWCCELADAMDDKDELVKAIDLLQAMERATNELQLRVHSSFASYSPFVERPPTSRKTKALGARNTNADISFASSSGSSPITPRAPKSAQHSTRSFNHNSFAFPTVLELGHIKRGAQKSRTTPSAVDTLDSRKEPDDDSPDTNDSHVRQKLFDANCLRAARDLGLQKQVTNLRSFSDFGGTQNFAKELVRSLSTATKSHEERCSIFQEKLKPFCEAFDINLDESLLQYLKDLCASTTATESSIQEAASVARCCESVGTKCQCILIVLRAALFCRYAPLWLTELSRDAVVWSSSDLSLQSELVEASRLLLIDSIVRKYVGNAGGELFRVDNPRHAVRLLDFVTQHFQQESVLNDALDLADAFNHLSRLDACVALCIQAVSDGCVELCSDFVEELYARDSLLADSTCVGVVSFCKELVNECSSSSLGRPASMQSKLKGRALDGTSAACAVLSVAFSQSSTIATESLSGAYSKVDCSHLKALKRDFLRINELQRNHSVFLSFSDLRNTTTLLKTAATLMSPIVTAYCAGEWREFTLKLAHAKRACSLLAGASECQEMEFWCAAVSMVASPMKWTHDDGICIDFLVDVGVLGGFGHSDLGNYDAHCHFSVSARASLSVAFSLCLKASNGNKSGFNGFNENIARAVSLVHDYCLATCPGNLLIQCQGLSTLAEMVWHVLLRGDEGVSEKLENFRKVLLIKSWSSRFQLGAGMKHPAATDPAEHSCRAPTLHPTWYIGDGLLLPPLESILRSVSFCKDVMNALTVSSLRFVPLASSGISEMTKFLFHRGALSCSLRLLTRSSLLFLCSYSTPNIAYGSLTASIQEVFTASVERSLGGTGNGIISKTVDSQNAVSFLLSLPVKLAFKVYKSALPTAISTRDYKRVIALANIGIVAGGSGATNSVRSGWKNQDKLIAQCKKISNQSVWWKFLRKHRISFDQKLLDEDKGSMDKSRVSYSQKLLVPIIVRLLAMTKERSGSPVQGILQVLNRYAETFGLKQEKIVEAYIKYLLSSPDDKANSEDARLHLQKVEASVKELFPLLQPKTQQAFILRSCVSALEQNELSSKDYDRHLLVLQLYRDTLQSFMGLTNEKLDHQRLEAEHENILRRIDTLAILCSVFEGERKKEKPPFPPFFRPLPTKFSSYTDGSPTQYCGILGKGNNCSDDLFDPLEPLHGVVLRSHDKNASTSLAPLGIPLGLPGGYIHARFLMEHFRLSAQQGSTLPSFEQDVLPIFGRIQASRDKASLAEFCASMFVGHDQDRLRCLEVALTWAIKFSSEAEQRKRISRDAKEVLSDLAQRVLAQEEMKALETVERLSKSKSSLSDKIKVVTALAQDPTLAPITKDLVKKLDQTVWKSHQDMPQPESVVDVLLTESSLIAANRCLDSVPLSMHLFRQFCAVVNNACQALAEEHSHIQVGKTAWKMVERWLFQGDEAINTEIELQTNLKNKRKADPTSPALVVKKASKTLAPEEEDTINFIMDLSAIQDTDEQVWCEETQTNSNSEDNPITSDEERSSLLKCEHEQAEQMTIRTALRVAFVLACHDQDNSSIHESAETTPNVVDPRSSVRSGGKGKAGGLLARIEKLGSKQNTHVMACARDLLKVVFAKPELQCKSRLTEEADRLVSTTITFAMRHRALRSASVLVPQEALEKVIEDEGYLEVGGGSPCCSLKQCCFGAYVANECELLGMPLTHSDLGHISSMHFSSYARTLWRHHRDGDQKGSRGRLLLLLLQMSLKDETNIDAAFVELILKEMERLHLPRSLLLACECIVALREEIGSEKHDSLLSACGSIVNEGVASCAKAIFTEVRERFGTSIACKNDTEDLVDVAIRTIHRLGRVIRKLDCQENTSDGLLLQFIEALGDTANLLSGIESIAGSLRQTLLNSVRQVSDEQLRSELVGKMQISA